MADRLTQLQDCLDQLTVQMHACLMYINTKAPYLAIDQQPDWDPLKNDDSKLGGDALDTQTTNPASQANGDPNADPQSHERPEMPDSPEKFNEALKELAHDLVMKEQQLEYLISVLPGIGQSEREQTKRLRELEEQLRSVEQERLEAVQEKETLVEKLDEVIRRVRRY